jgi:hypothetical protein
MRPNRQELLKVGSAVRFVRVILAIVILAQPLGRGLLRRDATDARVPTIPVSLLANAMSCGLAVILAVFKVRRIGGPPRTVELHS